MQKIKHLFIRWCFCGTPEEYEEGKRVHCEELTVYRRRWYYVVGLILSVSPLIHLGWTYYTVDVWTCLVLFALGSMLIRGTISEHYVVKILRERKLRSRGQGKQ